MKTINQLNAALLLVGLAIFFGILGSRPIPAPVPTAAQLQAAVAEIQHNWGQ